MPTTAAAITADLNWIIKTPPLVSAFCPLLSEPQGALPALLNSEFELDQLPVTQPLGYYYEWLWQQLLSSQPVESLSNVTIDQPGSTLGEFDLLYRSETAEQPIHRELAIKFYLQAPDTDGQAPWHWIGPNPMDRLDLKLAKMLQKQVRLGLHPSALRVLQQRGWSCPRAEALIQGRLFRTWPQQAQLPEELNTGAPQGIWLLLSQLTDFLQQQPDLEWYLLTKEQWLAGAGTRIQPEEIRHNLFKYGTQFRLKKHGDDWGYLMLVADSWPEKVRRSWKKKPCHNWSELYQQAEINALTLCAGDSD